MACPYGTYDPRGRVGSRAPVKKSSPSISSSRLRRAVGDQPGEREIRRDRLENRVQASDRMRG
jgi:hypothetical protein